MYGDRNSKQANEYATKRLQQIEKAKALKEKRNNDSVSINNESRESFIKSSADQNNSNKLILNSCNAAIDIQSFNDKLGRPIAERIVVKPNYLTKQPQIIENSGNFTYSFNINKLCTFLNPPIDPSGFLLDLSDRPIMCGAFTDDCSEAAFGSADHAIYRVFLDRRIRSQIDDIMTNKIDSKISRKVDTKIHRKLYSKSSGHNDWITTVDYIKDSSKRLVSGGIDGRLCLWTNDVCQNLIGGHSKSITKVLCTSNIIFTCCYGGQIGIWNTLRSSGNLSPNRVISIDSDDPINNCVLHLNGQSIATSYKSGYIHVWEVESGVLSTRLRAHPSAITSFISDKNHILVSGGSDGYIKVWDLRSSNGLIYKSKIHDSTITSIIMNDKYLISGGADSAVTISDIRKNYQISRQLTNHRMGIYSVVMSSDINCLMVGDGSGIVSCYDLNNYELKYGLCASQSGGITVLGLSNNNQLITGSQDGKAIIYQYN